MGPHPSKIHPKLQESAMTVRKRASALSPSEKQRYIDCINQLNSGPGPTPFATLVSFHADMSHNMHGSMGTVGRQRFLPWHRRFLMELEKKMQAIDPLAFIPYWKWTTNRSLPSWINNDKPTVKVPAVSGMPGTTITVTRSSTHPSGLPTAAQLDNLVKNTSIDYTQFTSQLEGYHNVVHGWVGGTMNNIMVSPSDPVFWMHHAMIDRLWSLWQAKPGNAGKKPTLSGANATLDPWSDTAANVSSIATLGYSYGP
jgi:tyrosinase